PFFPSHADLSRDPFAAARRKNPLSAGGSLLFGANVRLTCPQGGDIITKMTNFAPPEEPLFRCGGERPITKTCRGRPARPTGRGTADRGRGISPDKQGRRRCHG